MLRRLRRVLILFLALVALAVVGFVYLSSGAGDPVTEENFERIRLGMTEAEVVSIMGAPKARDSLGIRFGIADSVLYGKPYDCLDEDWWHGDEEKLDLLAWERNYVVWPRTGCLERIVVHFDRGHHKIVWKTYDRVVRDRVLRSITEDPRERREDP